MVNVKTILIGLVGMNKEITFILILILLFSSFVKADLIKFQCVMNDWNNEPMETFSLTIGVETKRAIQTLKKGNLEMDLLVSENYYELGMYTDGSKNKDRFIPVLKLNKATLNIDYAKYVDLVKPISCLKL